jgi:hypothetical protein
MNIKVQASYLSSLEALQRAMVEKKRDYATPSLPGTFSAKAEALLNARITRLWNEFLSVAREYPQEKRRAAA